MKIAVIGLGYVGTVTAAGLASKGHEVWGVDVDPSKVDALRRGRSPVVEPGIEALIRGAVDGGTLHAGTDTAQAIEGADVSLLCVGTPSSPDGNTDLRFMQRALEDIADAMHRTSPPASGFHAVVVRSTVPPGTGDDLAAHTFAPERVAQGWQVGTAMCPEFLREGSSVADFFAPPMVVLGTADQRVRESVEEMFAFLGQPVRHVDVRTAEALKYACNAFHATKVSFTNELSRIFRAVGVDSRDVMDIFCEDTVLNISPAYLRPGFAFGGSCLPKDLRALLHMARSHSLDVPLLAGIQRTNELVIADVVDRVIATRCRNVAMLGLSFKMDTDDLRESPNVELVERLVGKGFQVTIFDPIVNPAALIGTNRRYVDAHLPHLGRLLASSADDAVAGADLAIVATSEASAVRAVLHHAPSHVIDLTGRLGEEAERLPGYQGIGWAL
jgi:GDP-mannose 6-dehydrogenase